MRKTVGIVLAGGLSRRFGSPKAFAMVGGRYFHEWAVEALKEHCDEVVIVTRPELIDHYLVEVGLTTDSPEFAGLGPLAGILSVMESVQADRYIVLPCDMPFVDSEVMGKLLARHVNGVTAVMAEGRHHPLVSVWDRDAEPVIREALENEQNRVMPVLSRVGVTWVDGNELADDVKQVFTNVNSPVVLERSEKNERNHR
ncbi:molybdenum cofactor guanylyltransferase [Sporosarcina sp. ACRSM]|uniref:molybdenum cofactor guanylyltransferase n=1 Tax=Sporosarcina sp. ACRSM TaxID=2918216 RepID=UPI001EF4FFEF|nr:molybdenum cofactor guanylyltransferase [Sporosarcina sp. ACRSM]MCG7334968.1 molybdenum cofactor guanylyltransferase [Sporosarcina sp. ACRSM]